MSRFGRRDEGGSAAVEFALVSVPLMWLVLGIIQYGLFFWSMQGASDVARTAARSTAVGSAAGCAGLVAQVRTAVSGLAPAGGVATTTVSRTFPSAVGAVKVGDVAVITVTYNAFDLHVPAVPLPNNGKIVTTVQVRVENVASAPQVCS